MEDSLIVSNTTPIINFAQIGRLDLLASLFGGVSITPAVQRELVAKRGRFELAAGAVERGEFDILPSDPLVAKCLAALLHPGEAECLAFAMERPGTLLLFDDLAARELAAANDCRFVGTLGILIEAKRVDLVEKLAPFIGDLRTLAGFWISDRLEARVLAEVDER